VSLRGKIVAYLVVIHALLGVIAYLALRDRPVWLLVAEGVFLLSIVFGILLVRSFFIPLELIRTGAELVAEQDFTSTFRAVGQQEMDSLIEVYNRMIARLREERLRVEEQNRFLDDLLAASPAGVVTLDFDGRIDLVNPAAAAIWGSPAEAIAGRRPEETGTALGAALVALPTGGSRVVAERGRRFKASRATYYDHGFARSFFVIEELTEELRRSERDAYDTLIRMISHEVNNSVGAVGSLLESAAELVAEGGGGRAEAPEEGRATAPEPGGVPDPGPTPNADPEPRSGPGPSPHLRKSSAGDGRADAAGTAGRVTEALQVAGARLGRLREFVSGYAEVVRLPEPERRPCDVATLVDEILILLGPELTRRRIEMRWSERDDLPPIPLDRNQIEQVLVNVLKNAMEAIGEDGRIDISLTRDTEGTGTATLTLHDSGPGLTPEALERLFTPFYSTKRDGRGLGLTLAHEVLTRHGFDHTLRNHPEGGAELTIRF